MYFIQPTLKFREFLGSFFVGGSEKELSEKLSNYFPNREIFFTDSGRSALALIIEKLGLKNSTMAVPAYICNVLKPIFDHYGIRLVFLDIDPETFQPNLNEYRSKITDEVKAILICPTYGFPVPNETADYLKLAKRIIIADCAQCMNFNFLKEKSQENSFNAFYYSLPKISPAPDGGVAIIANTTQSTQNFPRSSFSLGFLKNLLKSCGILNFFIQKTRDLLNLNNVGNLRWKNITAPHQISIKIFSNYLQKILEKKSTSFCVPILCIANRDGILKKIRKNNIFAEIIWSDPLVFSYPYNRHCPNTDKLARQIICLPNMPENEINKIKIILKQSSP
ncbi:DegT/DnrJ/EryC1/StrS family aminotransferase [Patescibacteria group bacterium]|nr:DegT/DnrJ/EryC1/StrS family aminotransferase [Patescibacteria group bacterium]